MTRPIEIRINCKICGEAGNYYTLASAYIIDQTLDGRIIDISGGIESLYLMQCSKCKFTAPDISEVKDKDVPKIKKIINSKEYQTALTNPLFSEYYVNKNVCWAIICEKLKNFVDAGWAYLHCAWKCEYYKIEDKRKVIKVKFREKSEPTISLTKQFRKKAIECFKKAKEEGKNFARSKQEELITMIDTLRQIEEFEEAQKLLNQAKKTAQNPQTKKLLNFENNLIKQKDSSPHTYSEVFKHKR